MKKIIFVLCCGVFLSTGRNANAQTATFNYTGSLQTWTVPCGVTAITINASAGSGGSSTGYAYDTPGLGATITSPAITVTSGHTIDIIVGQVGVTGNYGGGGGGGSFVWDGSSTTLLVVAGGGGGAGYYSGSPDYNGGNGQTNTATLNTPTLGVPNTWTEAGGSGGNGGTGGSAECWDAGGGAGWSSNGGSGSGGSSGTVGGGYDPANGAAGGTGGNSYAVNGGYGGGGGGDVSGGGGGGYNGGGAGYGCYPYGGGGGGGSYCITGTPTTTTNSGNGSVIITWVVPAALSVTATAVSNVSCHGGSNASANAVVTGGGSPYTYLWTPSSQTNATATGLSAGTYTIGVTDACGHTASASVAITQPLVLAATATTSTNVTCHGGSTGATASTVTGGSTPYTYSWTGGSTNATATGLTAGSYTLTVHDMNGCSATASTVVTQPNALVIDTTFTTANVLCNSGNTGSAKTVVSGGSSPYTYLWTPGGATKDTASGLSAGTYTLTVSDACGASATTSATITQPTAIGITFVSTPDNGTTNGTIALTVSGGNSPYMYVWTPSGKTTATISSESAGTYKCIVTDANGCKDSISVKIKSIAGIDGISDNSPQIVVYPNPNNGQFNIESSIDGASSVEIYNILGEKVFTRNLSTTKGTNTINVGNQPNGVYLYRIISDSGDLLGEGRIAIQK